MKRLLFFPLAAVAATAISAESPNVIVVFTDDQGFEDLGCYGSPLISTPEIDKFAKSGLRLTNFYVSASVSSASRAGLLTGRLNCRNGVGGVYFPDAVGMPSSEITIAEELQKLGYATGCFGKWHLGDKAGHLPLDQGFDQYYGIPYSNDMFIGASHKFSPDVEFRDGYTMERAREDQKFVASTKNNALRKKQLKYASPMFEGSEIAEYPTDQATTTRRYFDRAMKFIDESNKGDKPFFAYITPAMPHVPLYASEQFRGRSKRGLYGDAVEEIDWNVGRLIEFVKEKGLDKNTLIIFATDNGPWTGQKENGGSAGKFRDGKFSLYEGGVRVPCIIRWSGVVPKGVTSDELVRSIDLFPTILSFCGKGEFEQVIDGEDISKFLEKPQKVKLDNSYLYILNGTIKGIRSGDWIYLPTSGKRAPKAGDAPELFNIKDDVSQQRNLHDSNPEKVAQMKRLLDEAKIKYTK